MMNRKLHMLFDIIRPRSASFVGEINRRMEQDFNPRHETDKRSFTLGQKLLLRDYRNGHAKWTRETVESKRGYVMYDVMVDAQIWAHCANQNKQDLLTSRSIYWWKASTCQR
ncbi:unnamed protein product [Dicrocoelium dendriticum]|nr:unnamed protein product [Dicrocoelium dendriticum]